MKTNLRKYLLSAGALLAFALMANADIVTPGHDVPATTIGVDTSTLVLTTGTIDIATDALRVNYTEWVFTDGSGNLEFVIQANVDSTSASSLEHLISGGFLVAGGVTTDVG